MSIPPKNPVPIRKRCRRINTPGDCHYLTFSRFKRQPFLLRDRARHWLAGALAQAKRKHPFRLIAYVFMPEHLHLLLLPLDRPYDISDILGSIKTPVARATHREWSSAGHYAKMETGPVNVDDGDLPWTAR